MNTFISEFLISITSEYHSGYSVPHGPESLEILKINNKRHDHSQYGSLDTTEATFHPIYTGLAPLSNWCVPLRSSIMRMRWWLLPTPNYGEGWHPTSNRPQHTDNHVAAVERRTIELSAFIFWQVIINCYMTWKTNNFHSVCFGIPVSLPTFQDYCYGVRKEALLRKYKHWTFQDHSYWVGKEALFRWSLII